MLRLGERVAVGDPVAGEGPMSVERLVDSMVSGEAGAGCDGGGCRLAVTRREAQPVTKHKQAKHSRKSRFVRPRVASE